MRFISVWIVIFPSKI